MADIEGVVRRLRSEGGDLPAIEVKAAAGGFPDSIVATLCALANRPGGGMVILGLDEATGFSPVPLPDRRRLKATLASVARQSVQPPVSLDIDEARVEGQPVVVAVVAETPPSHKPCSVIGGASRGVWVRAWDGDYRASDAEIQALLANRSQPRADAEPVDTATLSDLDADLVQQYVSSCRSGSAQLARISDTNELLWRTGVLVGDNRTPSVAGLLALGIYPQQHLPAASLQAVLAPARNEPPGSRARDAKRLDGPIPQILTEAVAWAARVTPTAITTTTSGSVIDRPTWPPDAIRELVSNALIHRDLAPWALGETSLLRIDEGRLVVANPGGLYGLTVDRLGHIGVTSARNANLVRICQYVRLPDGTRAVEALATGIPTVLQSLETAGLPPPIFDDDGLRFTAVLRHAPSDSRPSTPTGSAAAVLTALAAGPKTVNQLAVATGLAPANIRKRLRQLNADGLVVRHGGPGRVTLYERTD